eukprot:CAMPEP_0175074652 /NCGR_PEP_ID=MMETSP0052_2-20121109/21452_1 /TAXON_ID=51329 ORGANISM="Polytomella parva, Strain SAG 63-3" /NCGR_SAMPLE_ID=MMETSP0052_2 /ASSEMBLY_ACC=CAM_ASM_000194 /LENGTH=582 /DNA_ID=CAMNT_0016343027 /DNA_START=16 /DNA_END=1761 /DNA_ORIENTATION=-
MVEINHKLEEEEEEEEDFPNGSQNDEEEVANSADDASSKSKKKKKKKKKKSKAKTAAGNDDSSAPSTPNKAESDKRFAAAIEAAKHNSEITLKLNSCNLNDAKIKKLMEALKTNVSVNFLDFSDNQIGDEGAQILATALALNILKDLIEIDLRDNPISDFGMTVLEGLQIHRKNLMIKAGSKPTPSSTDELSKDSELKEITKGPLFNKYFQTNSADEDDEPSDVSDGGLPPKELWNKVTKLLAKGVSSVPELGDLLGQLVPLVQQDVNSLPSHPSHGTAHAIVAARPHLAACMSNLALLEQVLILEPPKVSNQHNKTPQPAVGGHRVRCVEILAALVGTGYQSVDRVLCGSKAIALALSLAMRSPCCSVLHARTIGLVSAVVNSKTPEMYGPLFTEGFGSGIRVDGSVDGLEPIGGPVNNAGKGGNGVCEANSNGATGQSESISKKKRNRRKKKKNAAAAAAVAAASASGNNNEKDEEEGEEGNEQDESAEKGNADLLPPFHTMLIKILRESYMESSGKRESRGAFAHAAVKSLLTREHEPHINPNTSLKKMLLTDPEWIPTMEAYEGAYNRIQDEQRGHLW